MQQQILKSPNARASLFNVLYFLVSKFSALNNFTILIADNASSAATDESPNNSWFFDEANLSFLENFYAKYS